LLKIVLPEVTIVHPGAGPIPGRRLLSVFENTIILYLQQVKLGSGEKNKACIFGLYAKSLLCNGKQQYTYDT